MSGGWPSSVVTSAPIARSGFATRSMGLAAGWRSPRSTDSNGDDEARPATAASSSLCSRSRARGRLDERSPPFTLKVEGVEVEGRNTCGSTWNRVAHRLPKGSRPKVRVQVEPRARASRGKWRSRECRGTGANLRVDSDPFAVAAIRSHRCEIDLSPGTRTSPPPGARRHASPHRCLTPAGWDRGRRRRGPRRHDPLRPRPR